MRIVEQNVSIIKQEPGIIGMKKHIERVSRISYRSEDRITEESYVKFTQMLYNRGHWATFNLGTVYLKIPKSYLNIINSEEFIFVNSLFNREDERMAWNRKYVDEDYYYITTNYRVICQLEAESMMLKYWCEPTEFHYHRVTSNWITSRSISQQVLRHRVFSPLMESTRYCNFSIAKFNGEVQFVYPCWAEDEWNRYLSTGKLDYFYNTNSLTVQNKWDLLKNESELVKHRDRFYRDSEEEYLWEVSNGLKPEDARDSLGMGLKTEFCMCGYIDDYCRTPDENLPEKAGFFYLRTARDAQRDVRMLANKLKADFISEGLDKLK